LAEHEPNCPKDTSPRTFGPGTRIASSKRMKIVLTGGPSAGKTTIAEALVRAYWDRVALAPESASILFHGGFPRESGEESVVCQQRAIYYVQRELENSVSLAFPGRAMICDRGTLDGLAFWPRAEEEFFHGVETTKLQEINRYDWVIHLETAAREAYQPSAIRRESYEEARSIDRKLKTIWQAHPRWAVIPNNLNFSAKINLTLLAVKMMLDKEPASRIEAILGPKSLLPPQALE